MLQLMDTFVLNEIDDEEEQVGWLVNAVPDGNGTELDDYEWIAEDSELYEACVKYFDETYFKEYEEEFKAYIAEEFLKKENLLAEKN